MPQLKPIVSRRCSCHVWVVKPDTRQYLAALAIAAIYKFSFRKPWILFKPVWAVLMSLLPWPRVSDDIFKLRMEDCKACSLYYSPLKTCSSPLAHPIAVFSSLGCNCYLPKKNKLKYATCWARQHRPEMNIGWRKELNSAEP